ncbi:serine acetyltransferase [Neobacillus ginsengisoli]|uniref:Serine O-acetyltransferase n=1 Tax=Neobacillus ginsengisoli TaxID=904295 RepID=A0ABT9XZ34_9BACI|nr:serine acetyltransferase [Neobacillus ginsengisoli]MDQ0200741.1 serine O-acetyltransferase [Neobacillus ginsengisoli]
MNFRKILQNYTRCYNHKKYWKRRFAIYNPNISRIKKAFYLYYIKRTEGKQGAYLGTKTENGKCNFKDSPILPHGLIGIVISAQSIIGSNCQIGHQVTIGRSKGQSPTIGDNCFIGPGAKIFGGVHIGNNVRIGANCIVCTDIPDNATVVLDKPRIIIKEENYKYSIL